MDKLNYMTKWKSEKKRIKYQNKLERRKINKAKKLERNIKHKEKKETRRATYKEYISSKEWKYKRQLVIERCHGICEECNLEKVKHIHHLTYQNFGNEPLKELLGLCVECHKVKHPHKFLKKRKKRLRQWEKYFDETL